jgi:hypothetical protein
MCNIVQLVALVVSTTGAQTLCWQVTSASDKPLSLQPMPALSFVHLPEKQSPSPATRNMNQYEAQHMPIVDTNSCQPFS